MGEGGDRKKDQDVILFLTFNINTNGKETEMKTTLKVNYND